MEDLKTRVGLRILECLDNLLLYDFIIIISKMQVNPRVWTRTPANVRIPYYITLSHYIL